MALDLASPSGRRLQDWFTTRTRDALMKALYEDHGLEEETIVAILERPCPSWGAVLQALYPYQIAMHVAAYVD
jgi:hypothetical protein